VFTLTHLKGRALRGLLDKQALVAAALNETVRRLATSSRAQPEEVSAATVAADTIGLAPVALSIFYVRRTHNRGDEPMLWRRWLKWLIVVDAKRQVLLVQEACSSGPYNSSAMLRPLTEAAREVASARRGSGRCDISIASREPPLRARMVRSGETEPGEAGQGNMWASRGHRARMRVAFPHVAFPHVAFPSRLYRRRALVESVFSALKRKLCGHGHRVGALRRSGYRRCC
jgi:hypothetical protein